MARTDGGNGVPAAIFGGWRKNEHGNSELRSLVLAVWLVMAGEGGGDGGKKVAAVVALHGDASTKLLWGNK